MRRAVAGAGPVRAVYRRAVVRVRAAGRRSLARSGRPEPDGVLVPVVPGARPGRARRLRRGIASVGRVPEDMAVRAPQLHHALRAFVLGAFAYLLRELDDAGRGAAVRVRGARGQRRPGALRVPAARSRLRRGAGRPASRARGRDDRARGARPRAGGGDLRARPCRRRPVRGRRALPYRARRPPDPRRRGVRRLRLGRRLVRPRLRGARALALRRTPDVRRRRAAHRNHRPGSSGSSARASASAPPPTASSLATGPRRRGFCRPGFGREADRYCVLELRAALGPGEDVPDAPAEIADAVSAIRLATAAPLAAGPVLFETLDGRPYGIRPVLPIAATQPPGEPTRLDEFRGAARGRAPRPARARRRRHVPRRGARPVGAVALPARAVPLGAASRVACRAPRRDVAAPRVGAPRGGRRAARGTPSRPGGARRRRRGDVSGGDRRRVARSSRFCARAIGPGSSVGSTGCCSGSPFPGACARRRRRRVELSADEGARARGARGL